MQIREHAKATTDKPAVILYPSGTVVAFGELEARANRLAHLFRQAGLGGVDELRGFQGESLSASASGSLSGSEAKSAYRRGSGLHISIRLFGLCFGATVLMKRIPYTTVGVEPVLRFIPPWGIS